MEFKLSDIVDIVNGSTPSTSNREYWGGDIVWITPKDLSDQNTKYIYHGDRFITNKGMSESNLTLLPVNSILLTTRAPIGLVSINKISCCTNQGFKNLVPDSSKVDFEYLYYYIKLHIDDIKNLGSGTTFREVSKTVLSDFNVSIPDIQTQCRVSNVFKNIDDKIENNNKINNELESLAKTIYDYWFLQFEFPNEEGKTYKSSGGAMVWNEELNMEIPISWNVESITTVAEVYQPKTISISDLNDSFDYPVYGAGGYMGRYSQYNHENSELVISCRGVCGEIFQTMPNSWITGNAMVVHANGQDVTINYLYEFLKAFGVSKYVTGSVQKQLTRENLSHMPVLCPQTDILNKYEEIAQRIRSMIENNIRENEELTQLRDFLLPLLMNGQVGFKD